jgi:hypothetical protein
VRTLGLAMLVVLCSSSTSMAIEEPSFELEKEYEEFEIRRYGRALVAQTEVREEFGDAGNRAFRILADYIFGKNSTKEKIAMTAPVTQSRSKTGYAVQFAMPSKYKSDTLPAPVDARVTILEVPARRVAVYSYSGSWSEERYNEKLVDFTQLIAKAKLKTIGEPIFARFNSPFQLWFLRRNEIWLELIECLGD